MTFLSNMDLQWCWSPFL